MVSKYVHSSIALLLARGALGATEVAEPTGDGARPYKILGQPKSFRGGSKPLYASKGITSEEIKEYIENTVREAMPDGFEFNDSDFLVAAWGGMCWPVDGRSVNGGRPIPRKPKPDKPKYATEEQLKELRRLEGEARFNCIVPPRTKTACPEEGRYYFPAAAVPMVKGFQDICYKRDTPYKNFAGTAEDKAVRAQKFWTALGDMYFTTVSKIGEDKPEWALEHPMKEFDYRVDAGTGKARASAKGKGTGVVSFEENKQDLADVLAQRHEEQTDYQDLLEKFAEELYKNFQDAVEASTIPLAAGRSEPKLYFGFTGKWRYIDQEIFEQFAATIRKRFDDVSYDELKIELISGDDEARYGTISLCNIGRNQMCKVARRLGRKFLVSIESGNGSTQVGVVLVDRSLFEMLKREVHDFQGAAAEFRETLKALLEESSTN